MPVHYPAEFRHRTHTEREYDKFLLAVRCCATGHRDVHVEETTHGCIPGALAHRIKCVSTVVFGTSLIMMALPRDLAERLGHRVVRI